MARITVEDCLERDKVTSRFELVMMASKRAHQLQSEGKEPMVPEDDDKSTVVALREIADGHIGPQILDEVDEREVETTDQSMSEAVAAAEAALAAKTQGHLTEGEDDDEDEDDYEEIMDKAMDDMERMGKSLAAVDAHSGDEEDTDRAQQEQQEQPEQPKAQEAQEGQMRTSASHKQP